MAVLGRRLDLAGLHGGVHRRLLRGPRRLPRDQLAAAEPGAHALNAPGSGQDAPGRGRGGGGCEDELVVGAGHRDRGPAGQGARPRQWGLDGQRLLLGPRLLRHGRRAGMVLRAAAPALCRWLPERRGGAGPARRPRAALAARALLEGTACAGGGRLGIHNHTRARAKPTARPRRRERRGAATLGLRGQGGRGAAGAGEEGGEGSEGGEGESLAA